MLSRPRRNRSSKAIRDLIAETSISPKDFIAPVFVMEGSGVKEEISSMPGQYRLSLDLLIKEVKELINLGIHSIALFPVIDEKYKTSDASYCFNPDNINLKAISELREVFPDLNIMGDIALDPYSSDGHDGLVDKKTGKILNDPTLEVLAKMSIAQAQAGASLVGPSDMMDGRVSYIRRALDEENFKEVSIISYTAKYASAFYGPFRDALDSAPKAGDKKTYQMDPANAKEALREAFLDEQEGADILMVKPALAYLDIISLLRDNSSLPIAAYNVSGEYAMIKAAAQKGWIDGEKVALEVLTAIKRAGAKIILTYFAKEAAQTLSK